MLNIAGTRLPHVIVAVASIAAASGAHAETLQETVAARQLAQDWLDGKLQADKPPKVTYTGLPFTLRVSGHLPSKSSVIVNVLSPSFRQLEKMSNGRIIAYERYDQLVHPERAGVEALLAGTTDFAPCFSVWDPEKYPLMGVMGLPGVYPNTEIATVVSEELYDKYFRQDVEKQGVLMGRVKAGSSPALFSTKPIRTVGDFAGLKVGTAGNISREIVQALGGVPVRMGSNEVTKALASGEVEAVIFPDAGAEVFQLYKVAKYRTELNMGHYNAEYCVSKKFWDSLPRDLQIVFNTWARAQAQAETQIFYGVAGARSLEMFRAAGMELIELDAGQQRLWTEKTDVVIENWIRAREAAGRPARQLVEDVKAVVQRYKDMTLNDLMRRALNQPRVLNKIKPE